MDWTTRDLAERCGGVVLGSGDVIARRVAHVAHATTDALVFAEGGAQLRVALEGPAAVIVCRDGVVLPTGRAGIAAVSPRAAFALLAGILHPPRRPAPGVHASAVVASDAIVGARVSIGPFVTVGSGARIGDGVAIEAGCAIGADCVIGDDGWLRPRVVLYDGVRIGARALIHAGAVLGSDGFGHVPGPAGVVRFPQLGGLVIGDDVEIGALTAIDRGALTDTLLGARVKLDNHVHIGHGAVLGDDVLIAAQSGVAGSARLGDRAQIAGQVGVDRGAVIGPDVQLGSRTWALPGRTVAGPGAWLGAPAAPIGEARKVLAAHGLLPALIRRVRALERRLAELEGGRE